MNHISIGFDRAVSLAWLDLTAASVIDGMDQGEARKQLLAQLEDDLQGREALEKTVLVLLRLWYPDKSLQGLRDSALALLREIDAVDRTVVYWGMCLATYPFFRDAVAVVGRLSRLQPTITAPQVRKRLVEMHGDRAVIERARRHIFQTMLWWGILEKISARGVYRLHERRTIRNTDLQRWLLAAALHAERRETLPLDTVTALPELFPFDFTIEPVLLARDDRFDISTSADRQLLVSLAL